MYFIPPGAYAAGIFGARRPSPPEDGAVAVGHGLQGDARQRLWVKGFLLQKM